MRSSFFFFILLGLNLSGCSGSDSDQSSLSPYVDFECDSTDSAYCSSVYNGVPVYMGLTDESGFDCANELLYLPRSLFTPTFVFSGQTTASFNGNYLEGVVTNWVDSSNAAVFSMPNQDYTLCAFMDFNANGELDYFEVYSTTTINPTEDFYPLSQWQLP